MLVGSVFSMVLCICVVECMFMCCMFGGVVRCIGLLISIICVLRCVVVVVSV